MKFLNKVAIFFFLKKGRKHWHTLGEEKTEVLWKTLSLLFSIDALYFYSFPHGND